MDVWTDGWMDGWMDGSDRGVQSFVGFAKQMAYWHTKKKT